MKALAGNIDSRPEMEHLSGIVVETLSGSRKLSRPSPHVKQLAKNQARQPFHSSPPQYGTFS
jgi:hypothetical protein